MTEAWISEFRELARPSHVLDYDDLQKVGRMNHAITSQLDLKAHRMIENVGPAGSLLYQYQGDGTPMLLYEYKNTQMTEVAQVREVGRSCVELYCQVGFLRATDVMGHVELTPILKAPRPLEGKTAWHLSTAAREYFPFCHKLGAKCYSEHHFSWDRAPQKSCARKMAQSHNLYWRAVNARDEDPFNYMYELKSFCTSAGCGAHDINGGGGWSLDRFIVSDDKREQLKDTFIVIDSIRNSHKELHEHRYRWIVAKLQFVPEKDDYDTYYQFWTAVDVNPDVASYLAERRVFFSKWPARG